MLGIILTLVAVLVALSFAFYSDYSADNAPRRGGDSLQLRRSQPAARRRG